MGKLLGPNTMADAGRWRTPNSAPQATRASISRHDLSPPRRQRIAWKASVSTPGSSVLPGAKALHLRVGNVGRVAQRTCAARTRVCGAAAAAPARPVCVVRARTRATIAREVPLDHPRANVAVAHQRRALDGRRTEFPTSVALDTLAASSGNARAPSKGCLRSHRSR